MVLTHAHLDHCGYLPRLVRAGFRGPVYATAGTVELAAIVLADSAHLQEEDGGAREPRMAAREHDPARPLYTTADVERALRARVRPFEFGRTIAVAAGVTALSGRPGTSSARRGAARAGGRRRARCCSAATSAVPATRCCAPPQPPPGLRRRSSLESTYGAPRAADENAAEVLADAVRRTVGAAAACSSRRSPSTAPR